MNTIKLIKYILIFLAFIIAVFVDLLDIVLLIIKSGLSIVFIGFIVGFVGGVITKLCDITISFFLLLSTFFDEEKNESFQEYSMIKRAFKGLKKYRSVLIHFGGGVIPENLSFIFSFFGDFLPFRTLSLIVVMLFEFGVIEKLMSLLGRISMILPQTKGAQAASKVLSLISKK